MSYATLEQLIEHFGLEEITQLLADEHDLLTEELLLAMLNDSTSSYSSQEVQAAQGAVDRADVVIERISDFMDSNFSARHILPLDNPEQGNVVECCLALSRAALADDGTNTAKKVTEERDHWRQWLKDVSTGKAFLLEDRNHKTQGAAQRFHTRRPKSLLDGSGY